MRTLFTLVALVTAPAVAGALPPNFVAKEFVNADGSKSPYVVFVPPGLTPDDKPPVILFLHGAGETKGGKKQPVEVGIAPAIAKRKDFPAVVVIPQAEAKSRGVLGRWSPQSPDGQRALAMLDRTLEEYHCDPSRQYLTGLSMGGYGTWAMLAEYPDRFAAAVPVCGGGEPAKVSAFKDLPIWCFHGDQDEAVPVAQSRTMVEALKKAGSPVKYTEYAGVGHNSWDRAYGTDELYDWLFAQKKTR